MTTAHQLTTEQKTTLITELVACLYCIDGKVDPTAIYRISLSADLQKLMRKYDLTPEAADQGQHSTSTLLAHANSN